MGIISCEVEERGKAELRQPSRGMDHHKAMPSHDRKERELRRLRDEFVELASQQDKEIKDEIYLGRSDERSKNIEMRRTAIKTIIKKIVELESNERAS